MIRKFIFVFGSNESGIHGAGSARVAMENYGAVFGKSYGHYGESFAIPTKDVHVQDAIPLDRIQMYVQGFLAYAKSKPKLNFKVTCIGCGLAGLKHKDIAPMFKLAPSNCYFDETWKPWLGEDHNYWGKF